MPAQEIVGAAIAIAMIVFAIYLIIQWAQDRRASQPIPLREIPGLFSMMLHDDGTFVLKLREGHTTDIDDSFHGVRLLLADGYLKEIRADNLDLLEAFLRERGDYYEAASLLQEIDRPKAPVAHVLAAPSSKRKRPKALS